MTLFRHTLKSEKKSFLIWSASLMTALALFLFMYPSILKEKEAYEKILEVYPKEILDAFFIELDTLLSFHGYLGYVYGYILLALGIYSMRLGLSAIGKEVSSATSEFLFTKPVNRNRVLLEKGMAAIFLMLALTVLLLTTALSMEALYTVNSTPVVTILIIFSGFFLQLLFYSIGLLFGIVMRKLRFYTSTAIGAVSSFYILSMISQVLNKDYLRYISPFRYFNVSEIIRHKNYEVRFLFLSLALTCIFLVASTIALAKKPLSAG